MASSKGIRAELHDFHYSSDYIENGEMADQSFETTQQKHFDMNGRKNHRKSARSVGRLYRSLSSFAREYSSIFSSASHSLVGKRTKNEEEKLLSNNNDTVSSNGIHNGGTVVKEKVAMVESITCSIDHNGCVSKEKKVRDDDKRKKSEITNAHASLLKEKTKQDHTTKKEVIRSETKRINDLFRRKSFKSCGWTRTKSVTLSMNETNPTTLNNTNKYHEEDTIKKEADLYTSKKCPNCDTILHFAASNGELDIVKFYVEKNLYIDQQNKHLNTGLHCAVYYGHKEIVDVLLEHDPGIDMQNIDGDTALHIAVTTSKKYIIDKLIKKGANLNKQNNNGDTPLHLAAHKGCLQSVQILLMSGAKLDVKNKAGNTPLHSSINVCSNPNIVHVILQAVNGKRERIQPAHSNDQLMDQMIGNLIEVQSIIWKHKSETFQDIHVPSTFRHSVNVNCEETDNKRILSKSVTGLLSRLKDSENRKIPLIVNMKNNVGDTALHRAVRYCPKVLSMILNSNKIDTRIRNRKGETALHIAVKISNLKCQRILIKKNKRLLDIADNRYNTPLHWAAEWGYCRSIMYLLPTDYKKDMQNYAGNTALHLAILHTHFCIVWYLIENNVNVCIPNLDGDYPLHCAVKTGNFEIFQLVMKKSQTVIDRKNLQGDTALLLAIKLHSNESSLSVINMLIRHSADVNIQDQAGNTALHLSLLLKLNTLCYRLISTQKVLTHIQNKEGNTILHLITKGNQIEMLRFLHCTKIKDFHLKNHNGNTALSIAIRHQQLDMSMALLSYTWKVDLATYTQLCG